MHGNLWSDDHNAVVIVTVDQQGPVVAVRLQVRDVGTPDLDSAQRLQTECAEQGAIAHVLQLVVAWGRPAPARLPIGSRNPRARGDRAKREC